MDAPVSWSLEAFETIALLDEFENLLILDELRSFHAME